jgi:hypothetical protein
MFTFIVCKWLKLKSDLAKVTMVLIAMYMDFILIMIALEAYGIVP